MTRVNVSESDDKTVEHLNPNTSAAQSDRSSSREFILYALVRSLVFFLTRATSLDQVDNHRIRLIIHPSYPPLSGLQNPRVVI